MRTILRPAKLPDTHTGSHPYTLILRGVIDYWFLGSRSDAARALSVKPQQIAYWLAGHKKVPRRVIDQIRAATAQRTAASQARLQRWLTEELVQISLLKASIAALPDPDRRPYESDVRPRGGRSERSQKRRLAATKQARSDAARDYPNRVPLDLLALLHGQDQPAQPAGERNTTGKPDKPGKPAKA